MLILLPALSNAGTTLALGGLKVDMTIEDVIAIKGKPQSIVETSDFISHIYKYDGLEAHFRRNFLVGAYSDSKEICTPYVCTGSSLNLVFKLYGSQPLNDKGIYEFYSVDYSCWYRMKESEGFIQSIEIACQP